MSGSGSVAGSSAWGVVEVNGEGAKVSTGNRIVLVMALLAVALLAGCMPREGEVALPSVPTGLAASAGDYSDRVRLTWEPVTGAEHYQVHRAAEQEGPYSFLAETAVPTYDDAPLPAGALYWYRVGACSAAGCSALSPTALGYVGEDEADEPDPAEEFTASAGAYDDRIRVTWGAVSGATQYELYRAEEVVGPFELIATPTATHYEDVHQQENPLLRCHGYWYRLQACTAHGCTTIYSGVEGWRGTRIEGAVTGLVASDRGYPDRIRLTWDPLPGAASYVVYRGDKENVIGSTAEVTYDDVHHSSHNPLAAGVDYTYWVQATGHPEGACKPSKLSQQARGRASPAPGIPVELSSAAEEGRVTVRWSRGQSINPPTQFVIYRAATPAGFYVGIGEVSHTSLSFSDTTVDSGATYWYRVAARNAWAISQLSEAVSAQVP